MDDAFGGPAEIVFTAGELSAGIEDANRVLGADDPDKCTYELGYRGRQALFACLTCATNEPAGICTACSIHCHDDHEIVELWTKRDFRCDCGNSKFGDTKCKLQLEKDPCNTQNQYNQNFKGLYCSCHRPFPDPEREEQDLEEEEMTQCVVCEDWYHDGHLGLDPEGFDFEELICAGCYYSKCRFLALYSSIIPQAAAPGDKPNKIDSTAVLATEPEKQNNGTASADEYGAAKGAGVCRLADVLKGSTLEDAVSSLRDKDLVAAAGAIRAELPDPPLQDNADDQGPSTSKQVEGVCDASETDNGCQPLDPGSAGVPTSEPRDGGASLLGAPIASNEPSDEKANPNAAQAEDGGVEVGVGAASAGVEKKEVPLFLPSRWRSALCSCPVCSRLYEAEGVPFLISEADTVKAYEEAAQEVVREAEKQQDEELKRKLQTLGHVGQVEFLHGVEEFKQSLVQFLWLAFAPTGIEASCRELCHVGSCRGAKEMPNQSLLKMCTVLWTRCTRRGGEGTKSPGLVVHSLLSTMNLEVPVLYKHGILGIHQQAWLKFGDGMS